MNVYPVVLRSNLMWSETRKKGRNYFDYCLVFINQLFSFSRISEKYGVVDIILDRLPTERFKRNVVKGKLDLVGNIFTYIYLFIYLLVFEVLIVIKAPYLRHILFFMINNFLGYVYIYICCVFPGVHFEFGNCYIFEFEPFEDAKWDFGETSG